MTSKNAQIKTVLERGVGEIIPSDKGLGKALFSGKKLKVYIGIDPTAPFLHLGHSTGLLKLKQFQDLGHKTVLLIGDFTARVGDPSGKTKERKPLSPGQIKDNLKEYKKQAGKILDFKKTKIALNSEWHLRLKWEDILALSSSFTVQQMLQRDMFQKRIRSDKPVGINEFLYPIMQGYDAVALKTDVEIGGSDQLFNMLIGRDMVKERLNKEKYVLTTKLLVTSETGGKMSKSEGSMVALNDAPNNMYAKIMAFPDEAVRDCFELCTEVPMENIGDIMKMSPRDSKARLAREIVTMYHSKADAQKSEKEFNRVFSDHELPSDIPSKKIKKENITIVDLLLGAGLAGSRSEARRVIEQGGVTIDGKLISDRSQNIKIKKSMIIRLGKRKFVRIESE